MASGKVARRADASDIAALLDSPAVAALIARIDGAGDQRGRKGYGARALIGACLVKTLYGLPTWTRAASLLSDHSRLQDALGGCPSVWACYRFTVKLRENQPALADCLDAVCAELREQLPGLGVDVAIDASDMPAFANGHKYVYGRRDLPERERYSDPDASWGRRSAVSTRGGGSFYGYKLDMLTCSRTGLPLAWQARTAKRHESLYAAPLLDAVRARGFAPVTCAMDKGYSSLRVHGEMRERDCIAIVPRRKGCPIPPFTPIPEGTDEWKRLYTGRGAVEREFGRLKTDYGLAPLRVRGLARVQLHADLTMLGRLALACHRAQQVALAA